MSHWLWLGAMMLVALALLLWPLLRRADTGFARRDYELSVYRAQLEELERERARGLLGEAEAGAARLEIQRRMLAVDADRGKRRTPADRSRARRPAAAALLILFPALSAALYWQLGSPALPGQPFAERREVAAENSPGADLPSVESMIARLEDRLATDPEDVEGWFRLGGAYALTGAYGRAADAYRRAIDLRDDAPALHAALAEALTMASDGIVTEPARQALERALELDPQDPRARFYQGLELAQRGEQQGALDVWVRLAEDSPADAPWRPVLRERVAMLADDMGLDPEAVLPAPPEPGAADGADADQARAIENMAPEERSAMIRDMVEGLAARLEQQPDDVEGWRMLARSYGALGQPARAAEASAQAASLAPDDLAVQRDHADALLALQSPEEPLAPALVEQMRRVHALDRADPEALFFLGKAALERDEAGEARAYWQQLLAVLPQDAPERGQIERMVNQLEATD